MVSCCYLLAAPCSVLSVARMCCLHAGVLAQNLTVPLNTTLRPAAGYGPPQAQAPPPHHMQPAAGGGHPPANVISIALPHVARNVLDNNDSVKTEGLSGLATVEYRFLVPVRRSGVILGNKGGVSAMQGTGKGGG